MARGWPVLSHILPQVGLLASKTMFFYQPLVDTMGSMPLFGWARQVLSQPLIDEMDKGTQDGPGAVGGYNEAGWYPAEHAGLCDDDGDPPGRSGECFYLR
jgi:hypothetical protein